MKVLTANEAGDIDEWPCASSVLTGKSCQGKHCKHCKVGDTNE